MSNSNTIFDVQFMLDSFGKLMPYFPITLLIVAVAYICGLLIGLGCAIVKVYRIPVLLQIVDAYVSFIRGTPLLVQLYLIYFGIPVIIRLWNANFGTDYPTHGVPALLSVFIAYSLGDGAYFAETIRGAIEAVDRGSVEAAEAFGMTRGRTMLRVILPQALLIAMPNLGNMLLMLMKNTSLAFTIGVVDIMGQGKIIASSGYRFFEVYIALAVIYWCSCFVLARITGFVEKRLNVQRNRTA
ncbi:amino acid ABC transporter permease [Bifidobacterium callitrichos]|nr:amino acid ABC transporter permease [Bifidobacterium callitrichos]